MHEHESWVAAGSVAVATTHGETVLLDRQRGQYFVLNESGGVVWELVRRPGGATVAEMVAALDAEYDAPMEQMRGDVVALLGRLRRARLASVVS
jgi:Coenzyme PQQ synthesis protein D (PqqD)